MLAILSYIHPIDLLLVYIMKYYVYISKLLKNTKEEVFYPVLSFWTNSLIPMQKFLFAWSKE